MHAEDEFSASTYGTSKRDAVRVLAGEFPVRVVIEGATPDEVEPLVALIDRQVALGALGHLPVGGHKTRGAGWGRWEAKPWAIDDVRKARDWMPPKEPESPTPSIPHTKRTFIAQPAAAEAWVRTKHGTLDITALTLGEAATLAKAALGVQPLIAWWCDPTIDLGLTRPPATFGRTWPEEGKLQVDEVAFYAERAVWRAVRTAGGARYVLIEETSSTDDGAKKASVVHTPGRLHGLQRFSSANTGQGSVLLREWHVGDEILGFTLSKEQP
jgi:hypothetical protein